LKIIITGGYCARATYIYIYIIIIIIINCWQAKAAGTFIKYVEYFPKLVCTLFVTKPHSISSSFKLRQCFSNNISLKK